MSISRFPLLSSRKEEKYPLFRGRPPEGEAIPFAVKKFVRHNSFLIKHEACLRIANPVLPIH